MNHRFILAGIIGRNDSACNIAVMHLAYHFAFERANVRSAGILDTIKDYGAGGLIMSDIFDGEGAAGCAPIAAY